ncbi:MAG: decaprenyl-phosphate phosphoribosyltransferase [Thermoleophilaceae bacterium]
MVLTRVSLPMGQQEIPSRGRPEARIPAFAEPQGDVRTLSKSLNAAPSGEASIHQPGLRARGSEPGGERAVAPERPSRLSGLVRAARPRQWTKNVLVLAAPGAAGVLLAPRSALAVALAFVAFCLVASGTYLLNDARDVEADRRHPTKRNRPIAAGVISARLAVVSGVVLLVGGLAVAAAVRLELLAVVATYLVLTTAYTLKLRHVAVIDIATVASFFIVRAIAGGVAVDVPFSRWFLIVASFGSLFMVAGKRAGEYAELGEERASTRSTLGVYSLTYLREVRVIAAAVTLLAYCLWAFEQAGPGDPGPLFELSIVPFVIFILRWALLLEADRERAPEDLVLGDRGLQAAALAWAVVYGLGVYAGG